MKKVLSFVITAIVPVTALGFIASPADAAGTIKLTIRKDCQLKLAVFFTIHRNNL